MQHHRNVPGEEKIKEILKDIHASLLNNRLQSFADLFNDKDVTDALSVFVNLYNTTGTPCLRNIYFSETSDANWTRIYRLAMEFFCRCDDRFERINALDNFVSFLYFKKAILYVDSLL